MLLMANLLHRAFVRDKNTAKQVPAGAVPFPGFSTRREKTSPPTPEPKP